MEQKKLYIWMLAQFLYNNNSKMSGKELAEHLNRNNFLTSYATEYQGGRGVYKLIKETWTWLDSINLPEEAKKVAIVYVKEDGTYAYD